MTAFGTLPETVLQRPGMAACPWFVAPVVVVVNLVVDLFRHVADARMRVERTTGY